MVQSIRVPFVLTWLIVSGALPRLAAQGLAPLHQLNPVAASRSGLAFQPYLDPAPRWRATLSLDYGSMVEIGFRNTLADTSYLVDAEVLRLGVALRKDLGPRDFLLLDASLGGAYAGFLDGFLDWYHGLFGITFPEREDRPHNHFDYTIEPPGGARIRYRPTSLYLGDLGIGIGRRFDNHLQSLLLVTLPTATAPAGYGRGTVSFNLNNTLRAPITSRLLYEGSLGLGVTPRHGPLSAEQEAIFLLLTSGLRYRFLGRLSAFANLFYHTPYYHGTGNEQLQRSELTLDFGWILRTKGGREWHIGMTEDPWPSGPAIDLSFRFGTNW